MLKYKQVRLYIFIIYISSLCYSQFINPFSTSVIEEKLKDEGIDDSKINKLLQDGVQGKTNNASPSGLQSSGNIMNSPNSSDIINVEKIKKEIMDQVGPVGSGINNITKVTKKTNPTDANDVPVEDQLLIKKNTLDKIKEKRSKQIDKTLDSRKQKESFFGYNIFSDNSFIDTDTEIEEDQGCSVTDIFKYGGEECFRDMETRQLEKLKSVDNSVIATGGGIILRRQNQRMLQKIGKRVYLKVPRAELLKRVKNDLKRPLLKDKDPETVLNEMYEERGLLYEQAECIIETAQKSQQQIASEIIRILFNENSDYNF